MGAARSGGEEHRPAGPRPERDADRPGNRTVGGRPPLPILSLQRSAGNRAVVQRLDEDRKLRLSRPEPGGAFQYRTGDRAGTDGPESITDADVDAAFDNSLAAGRLQSVPMSSMARLDPAVAAKDPANAGQKFRSALEPPGAFAYGSPGAPTGPDARFHGAMGAAGGTPDAPVYNAAEQSEVTGPQTTYAVRVGPGGAFADQVFATRAEAEDYARSIAREEEGRIRDRSAIRHAWNPIDAVRVFAIPPNTVVLRSGIAPQPEDHPNVPSGRLGGGGMQVQIPFGTIDRSTAPLATFPVMEREPVPGAPASAPPGSTAALAANLRPTLRTELDGAQSRYRAVADQLSPLEAKTESNTALTDEEKARVAALTAQRSELEKRIGKLSDDMRLIDEPGASESSLTNLLARWNTQSDTGPVTETTIRSTVDASGFGRSREQVRTELKDGTALEARRSDAKKVDLSTPGAVGWSSATNSTFSNVTGAGSVSSSHGDSSKVTLAGGGIDYSHAVSDRVDVADTSRDYKAGSGSSTTTSVGTSGVTRTRQTTENVGDVTASRKETAGVTRDNGQLGVTKSTTSRFGEVDGDGNLVRGSEVKKTATGGLVAGPDGVGGFGSAGVAGNQAHGNGVTTGQTADVNGRFVVDVEQVKGKDPAQYVVTLRIDLGAKVGASAGKEAKDGSGGSKNVSASVSASGTVSRLFRHTMDAEATKRYLGDLAANGAAGAGREMRVLHLAAAGSLYEAQQLLVSPLGASADAARNMAEGDVDELDMAGTAGAKLGGGAKGGSGGGSAEIGYSRSGTLRHLVTKKGGRIVVTVDLSTGGTLSVGGSASYGLVGGGVGHEGSDTTGQSVTFTLDPGRPDYEAMYNRITSTDSVEELRTLAGQRKDLVSEHTESSGHSSADTLSATVGPAGVDLRTTHSYQQSVTTDAQGRRSHSYSGGTGGGMGVSLGGVRAAYSTTDTVASNVTADNRASGDASTATSETDVGATLTNLGNALKSPSKALGLVTGGTKVTQEHTEVMGMSLSDDDYATLAATAGTNAWTMAEFSNRNGADWRALGHRIAAAGGNRDTITRLLAEYAADHDNAAHAVAAVVRPAGSASGGTLYDWPGGLEQEKAAFAELVDADSVAPVRALEQSGKAKEALDLSTDTMRRIDGLAEGMQAKKDKFADQAVLQQMLTRVTKRRADLAGEAVVIGHRLHPVAMADHKVAPAVTAGPDPAEEEATRKEQARVAAKALVDGAMSQLAGYRAQEDREWAVIGAELAKKDSVWSRPDVYVMMPAFTRLKKDVYPPWEALVADVKKAAQEAGIDYWSLKLESSRLVPNRGWTRELEKQATAGYGSGLSVD